jgi:transcriptional regulator with XRE-family HTH domain
MTNVIPLGAETPGRRLYLLRVSRRLTRGALAELAGVSDTTVGRIERDELRPHRLTIRAIEDALAVERGTLDDGAS